MKQNSINGPYKVNGHKGQLTIYDEICDIRLCSIEYRKHIVKLFGEALAQKIFNPGFSQIEFDRLVEIYGK